MRTITITAKTANQAGAICSQQHGFYPDAIREVDSGTRGTKAWKCFESQQDANTWDRQQ